MKTLLAFTLSLCSAVAMLQYTTLDLAPLAMTITELDKDSVKSNIVGPLEFKGIVKELGKTIKGAIVSVYEDADGSGMSLTEIKKIVTPGNGEFAMKLEINKQYVVRIEKAGYTMKGIDIDTDVRMARPDYTKVPLFAFEVDMVKDIDGLAFKKSVANVFYQIKKNTFDYELDYSKEEMEEEERMLLEQEEKRKLAEITAQKKFEIEEAAKLLRDSDDATIEQKIKAAITIGKDDKKKTIEVLTDIFPLNDTLRAKKAEVIYNELQKERKKDGNSLADINFKNLFASAVAFEQSVAASAQTNQAKKSDELRAVKLDAERKKEAAMAVQQQSLELEMREKIAAANLKEEDRKRLQEKEKTDKLYYAIFNSNGDKKTAVAGIIKTFAKGDSYAEQKAEAIYLEYENTRLKGTTLAQMDFPKLFAAADIAEQLAIKEEIGKADAKDRVQAEVFLKKEQEIKIADEKQKADVILQGLKTAPKDEAAQIAIFTESFPKSDPFREQKALAMFEEYQAQQQVMKKTGNLNSQLDFGAMFAAADVAEQEAKVVAKEKLYDQKTLEQEKLEKQRDVVRQEKQKLGQQAALDAKQVQQAKMSEAKTQKEREIGKALETGGGDREKTVESIISTFPKGTELPRLKAEAMYDAYLQESKRLKSTGVVGAKLDYSVLFQAAEQAELVALQSQFEQKQAVQQEQLLAYEETRIEKTKEVLQVKAAEATKELALAEKSYNQTAQKVEQERIARLKTEQESKQAYEKALAMEQAQRQVLEKEKQEQVLANLEAERKSRLSSEDAEKERLAALKIAEQRKLEADAKAEAERRLVLAEKEKALAIVAQQKAEDERKREEAKRIAAETLAKAEQERARIVSEQAAVKEQQRLKVEADNARVAAQQAEALAAADRVKEEQRLKSESERIKLLNDQAAAKAATDRLKDEQRVLAEAEKARIANEQAALKAEADKVKEEERLKEEAERNRLANEQAAMKAAAEAKRQQELVAIEEAKRNAEDAKQLAAAEKLKKEQEIARLTNVAKESLVKSEPSKAMDAYQQVLAIDPASKDAQAGLKASQDALAAMAKVEAEKKALDDQYNSLISQGEKELASGALSEAKKSFTFASSLKPTDKIAKDWLEEVQRREQETAAAEEEKRQRERRYILLMQEGAQAMGANNIAVAKLRYDEAARMKPEESEPTKKLQQIADAERQLSAAADEKRQREEDAKRKFQEQAQADADRQKEADAARKEAMAQADLVKQQQVKGNEASEVERAKKFDEIKESIEKMNMNVEDQRKAFLSELSKLYPAGITEEAVTGKNYKILRNVINEAGIVTVYEKRTWDWGGIFWFKNGDIAITESLYKIELSKYGK